MPSNCNYLNSIQKPIIGLSPMDGVTDSPFRFIQKKHGKPDLMYTEFVSAEGFTHGSSAVMKELLYDESQRPIIAQIFGTDPHSFYITSLAVCALGFDGIDINMGCPAKNVAHRGAGAGLIRTPTLAQQIINSVKQAVHDWSEGIELSYIKAFIKEPIYHWVSETHAALPNNLNIRRNIPVSVKTRIGYDNPSVEEWVARLLEMEPAAITIHGRTLKQQYSGQADWDQIGLAANVVKNTSTLLFGNGDLRNRQEALKNCETYNIDGALIGRASFGNPWVFSSSLHPPTIQQSATVALEHARFYESVMNKFPKYSFLQMRKHLGWYIHSVPKASEIRSQLFQTNNSGEIEKVLQMHQLI